MSFQNRQGSRLICEQVQFMVGPNILVTAVMWAAVMTQFLFCRIVTESPVLVFGRAISPFTAR